MDQKNYRTKTEVASANRVLDCISIHVYHGLQGSWFGQGSSLAPFMISGCLLLHYAPRFEGMKAYRTPEGRVQLFRPIENIKRMNISAERMCLPQIDEEMMMEALKEIVRVDQDWVPSEPETSLYIRPFMFGTDEQLGIHTPHHCIFSIITCPVGSYFPEGINPVRIAIEKDDVRAVKGGTGFAKCGGNYAASLRAGEKAAAQGYAQVLWLDGVERKYIEEAGGMNVMFKIDGRSSPCASRSGPRRHYQEIPDRDTPVMGNTGRRAPDKPGRTAGSRKHRPS